MSFIESQKNQKQKPKEKQNNKHSLAQAWYGEFLSSTSQATRNLTFIEIGKFDDDFDYQEFESEGLSITIDILEDNEEIQIEDRLFLIPRGIIYGEMHFVPDGTDSMVLASGFQGLSQFFQKIDSGELPIPAYLYGDTNQQMAEFAYRLGFIRINDEEEEDFDLKDQNYTIVAPLNVVRANFEKLQVRSVNGKNIKDLLQERARREEENYTGGLEITSSFPSKKSTDENL